MTTIGGAQEAGTKLTIQQALNYAANGGFSGNNLVTIVAIAMAESGLNTAAYNGNDPYGGSFGLYQINGSHFSDTLNGVKGSVAAFNDPSQASKFAFGIWQQQGFRPWSTFTDGKYAENVLAVQQALKQNGVSPTVDPFPAYTGTPWYEYPVYADSTAPGGYHNTDVGTPVDTPITAPQSGTVTTVGYYPWGGQVTWKVDDPSQNHGVPYDFVIHLDAINPNIKNGTHINRGTFLGYSGGELSTLGLPALPSGLTHHATDSNHSTGPHLDIGVGTTPDVSMDSNQAASNALVSQAAALSIPFGTGDFLGSGNTIANTDPASANPLQTIAGYIHGAQNAPTYNSFNVKVHHTLVQNPGFYGICLAVDEAEQFPGLYNAISSNDLENPLAIPGDLLSSVVGTITGNALPFFIRSLLFLIGVFILFALIWQMFKPLIEIAPDIAKVAMLAA